MLCDICKQNLATVHLTQIVKGKTKKADLCETCSKTKGVDDPTGFSLADMLLGLGQAQEMEPPGVPEVKCPTCGFTQADFKKHGRPGCPECYNVFHEGLEAMLKTMHKGIRHLGKVPAIFSKSRDLQERIANLQTRLDASIAEEDFESAAKYRDAIRDIRAQISPPAAP